MTPKNREEFDSESASNDENGTRQPDKLLETAKPLDEAQHLVVIRHGDRWDYENPQAWKNHPNNRKGDPPLSSLGHQQARETGQYLDTLFQELGVAAQNITWLSSPFLRTLQTSTDALDAMTTLPNSKQIPIFPEPGVFEWDGKNGEWHASLPRDPTERMHYFPRLLNTVTSYEPLFVPTLPEPRSEFHARCRSTIAALNQRHSYQPKTALVIVTHAAACIGLALAATGTGTLADITPAAPCSVYHLQRFDSNPNWQLPTHTARGNGDTDHLSDLGDNTVPWNHFGDKSVNKGYTGPPDSRFAPTQCREEYAQRQQDTLSPSN